MSDQDGGRQCQRVGQDRQLAVQPVTEWIDELEGLVQARQLLHRQLDMRGRHHEGCHQSEEGGPVGDEPASEERRFEGGEPVLHKLGGSVLEVAVPRHQGDVARINQAGVTDDGRVADDAGPIPR